jgi:hypothetical protein
VCARRQSAVRRRPDDVRAIVIEQQHQVTVDKPVKEIKMFSKFKISRNLPSVVPVCNRCFLILQHHRRWMPPTW